ncbi:FadR family transcriptional regulator [Nocardioides mesophilus]|uniref:FadR family transcriptional regulator n=2 Tax=Nocardioides mesophilus TaxID=433659 RepID=A0A7G9RH35_9ACTN|nr:FadR family transcriptional regulator [Nocardioides mesophilus]
MLRAVRGHHAFEGCVEQLATAIRLGVYPRGSALPPERELAERMGVSRATLREAIAALRAADFVSTTRGRGGGTVVSYRAKRPSARGARALQPRRAELLDTLVFRRLVEPGACHVAASRGLSAEQRDFLAAAHDEVAAATDPARHRQADSRFHLALAAVTESPLTVRAVASVQADLHDMLNAIPVLEVNIAHSAVQHRAILDAILGGDPTRARRVMESHCDDTAALLRGLLA